MLLLLFEYIVGESLRMTYCFYHNTKNEARVASRAIYICGWRLYLLPLSLLRLHRAAAAGLMCTLAVDSDDDRLACERRHDSRGPRNRHKVFV